MAIFNKVKLNATNLLGLLLLAHFFAVSLNRVPNQQGRTYGHIWLMTLYWPVQFVTANGLGSFRKGWDHYFSLRDARGENQQLKAQLGQLNKQLLEAEDKAKLAAEYDAFVKWRSSQSFGVLDARVVARDGIQWFNTVWIDKGTLTGVQKDMPVVTPEGLVGRVIAAGPLVAKVLLLTDDRHGTGAMIGQALNSRLTGAVRGKNDALCEMRFLAAKDKITDGEMVITSGQDGIYPRGLAIGRVRLSPNAPGIPSTIDIDPAVQFNKLDLVGVLQVPKDQIRTQIEAFNDAEAEKQKLEKLQGRPRAEAKPLP